MAALVCNVKPEHGDDYRQKCDSTLGGWIEKKLKALKMTQKELAIRSGLSEAKISRIINGGHDAEIKEHDIDQIAIALTVTRAERDQMRYMAWPELVEIDKALDRRDGSVIKLNCVLADKKIPLLGKDYKE